MLPTIVPGEFYVLVSKRAGRDVAEILLTEDPHFKQFREIKVQTLAEVKI